ncbi:hypothetical protein JIN77_14980 [Verrucomicrobiaceae bacterium R5-34]|nr:hypothetical protein [Verrucomicrobiaceae bacterium R5-34]
MQFKSTESVRNSPASPAPEAAASAAPIPLNPALEALESQPAAAPAERTPARPAKKKSNLIPVLTAITVLVAAGVVTLWLAGKWKPSASGGAPNGGMSSMSMPSAEDEWLQRGWKKEAAEVLGKFMAAKTPEERMQYVIPNEHVLEQLKANFPAGYEESETPLSAFSFSDANLADRRRGIFLMQYRRPAQIDIREYFAPIGDVETVMGQKDVTLIEMAHRIDEDNLSQPVSINAFFKQTDEGLKLDASVFIQGKFRTFREFTEYPAPGESKIFRVVVNEVVSHALRNDKTHRSYKLSDYAYPQDFVNLPVEVDSEVGEILSVINWRGTSLLVPPRTATVELAWSDTKPSVLELKRVLCWEFLGVGGELGNTTPPADRSSSAAETQ